MSDTEQLEALLSTVAEEFEDTGFVGLYQFSWSQRSPDVPSDPAQVEVVALTAYKEFRRRTPTALVWLTWPTDLSRAQPADDNTEPILDMDPDGPTDEPFLALVPR